MAVILDYNKHVKSDAVLKKNRDSMLDSFDILLKKLYQAETLGLIPPFVKESGVYHIKDSAVNKLLEEAAMGDVIDMNAFRQRKEQDKTVGRGRTPAPTGFEFGYNNKNIIKNDATYKTKLTTENVQKHLLKVKELLEKSIHLEKGISQSAHYLTKEKAVVDSLNAREAAIKYARENNITISKNEVGNYVITSNSPL